MNRPQPMVQECVSLAASVNVALTGAPTPTRYTAQLDGDRPVILGGALAMVTVALSLTAGWTPSLAVSVTVSVPSSLQVKVVRALCESPKTQPVPTSTLDLAL